MENCIPRRNFTKSWKFLDRNGFEKDSPEKRETDYGK